MSFCLCSFQPWKGCLQSRMPTWDGIRGRPCSTGIRRILTHLQQVVYRMTSYYGTCLGTQVPQPFMYTLYSLTCMESLFLPGRRPEYLVHSAQTSQAL